AEAAEALAVAVTPEQWLEADAAVQARIRSGFRSLVNFCLDNGPRPEQLADVLEAAGDEFFRPRLDGLNAAELLLDQHDGPDALGERLREAAENCHPPLAGPGIAVDSAVNILALPDTDAGRRLGEWF